MTTATKSPAGTALDEVQAAYEKRREQEKRLADQDRYIGSLVRRARAAGCTWQAIADRAGTSDVAVIKAARRPERKA
ncbi:RNA polymerase sigma factor [Microbacterium phage Terij]|uniref:RNA polymerase sigma factor n=1 Tax=Microbacterium phage Terij TaxID=2686229 RepID=A0A6B9L951_9CAUD|nr:RNA polymerase sigma factor [Microbacterium phage Terij]QHB37213.1 RNA polymerase sigma factor [Microbacterium phage Terij]